MSSNDPTSGPPAAPPAKRRMLPPVTDVVKELGLVSKKEPSEHFKVARQVCAEELNRVKQGFESAPLEALVKRALRLLDPRGAAAAEAPRPAARPSYTPVESPAEPPADYTTLGPRKSTPARNSAASADPFEETTGALDLKWDREKTELFTEEPAREEPIPEPAPPPAILLAEDSSENFGEETLTRLGTEAAAVDLKNVFSREALPVAPEGPADWAEARQAGGDRAAGEDRAAGDDHEEGRHAGAGKGKIAWQGTAPAHEIFSSAAHPKRSFPVFWTLALLVVVAGGYWAGRLYLTGTTGSEKKPASLLLPLHRGPKAVPVPIEPSREFLAPEGQQTGTSADATTSGTKSASGTKSPGATTTGGAKASKEPRKKEAAFEPVPPRIIPAPPLPRSTPALLAAAAVPPASSTAEVPAKREGAASTASTASRTPVAEAHRPAEPHREAEPTPVVATANSPPPRVPDAARQLRPGTMATADWAGHEPVFMIHFSSYHDRKTAEHEAESLARKIGRAGHALGIDLGAKGVWYRVLLGDFATAEEAMGFRQELEAKKTPNLGWVYRIVGKAQSESGH